ncbi:MAG: hypothetical protein IKZ35_02600 [Clostridia bacterium]|nr:hypothetical protein [Clostridia bacterium]
MILDITKKNIDKVSTTLTNKFLNEIDKSYISKVSKVYEVENKKDFFEFVNIKLDEYLVRKDFIFNLIKDNLKDFNKIDDKGFLNFRMWKYKDFLNKVLNEIYLTYLEKIHYEKLLSLIGVILKNSNPIVYHLHIDINKKSLYEFYDDYFNDITNICITEFIKEYGEYDFLYNDILFSAILNLTPKIITFHHTKRLKNKELLNTLKKLYGENLIIS